LTPVSTPAPDRLASRAGRCPRRVVRRADPSQAPEVPRRVPTRMVKATGRSDAPVRPMIAAIAVAVGPRPYWTCSTTSGTVHARAPTAAPAGTDQRALDRSSPRAAPTTNGAHHAPR